MMNPVDARLAARTGTTAFGAVSGRLNVSHSGIAVIAMKNAGMIGRLVQSQFMSVLSSAADVRPATPLGSAGNFCATSDGHRRQP